MDSENSTQSFTSEFLDELSRKCGGDIILANDDIQDWLHGAGEEGMLLLTDDEIISEMITNNNDDDDQEVTIKRTVTDNGALNALNLCTKWAEENDVPSSDIMALKRIEEMAFNKVYNKTKKQKKINDYFSYKYVYTVYKFQKYC